MNWVETFRANRGCAAGATALVLLAGLSLFGRDVFRTSAGSSIRPLGATAVSPDGGDLFRVKSFLLDFAGDHSLNAATVTEQAVDGRANYTVQLRLASGAEQTVIVPGPPGGLQVEMHDMTGDNVPNDVVLRPALFSWLPTVLVNDGSGHYAVVVSGADPGAFSSPENLGSRRQNAQTFAFLRSSGFKSIPRPGGERMLIPQSERPLVLPSSQPLACGLAQVALSDRAPPLTA
jgi:hypothetical protein